LEDLSDIRERTRLRKAQRARHRPPRAAGGETPSNWGFAQLRQGISYKAALAGVLVYIINPAYTSQRCSACGHTTSADTNAAIHISRAAVIPPIVSETALPSRQGQAAALESVRYMTPNGCVYHMRKEDGVSSSTRFM
jgi:IS605 OrfB family transposase